MKTCVMLKWLVVWVALLTCTPFGSMAWGQATEAGANAAGSPVAPTVVGVDPFLGLRGMTLVLWDGTSLKSLLELKADPRRAGGAQVVVDGSTVLVWEKPALKVVDLTSGQARTLKTTVKELAACGAIVAGGHAYLVDGTSLVDVDLGKDTARLLKKNALTRKLPQCVALAFDAATGILTLSVGSSNYGDPESGDQEEQSLTFNIGKQPTAPARAKPVCTWSQEAVQGQPTIQVVLQGDNWFVDAGVAGKVLLDFIPGLAQMKSACADLVGDDPDEVSSCVEDRKPRLNCRYMAQRPLAVCTAVNYEHGSGDAPDNQGSIWVNLEAKSLKVVSSNDLASESVLSPSGCWIDDEGQMFGVGEGTEEMKGVDVLEWR